MSKPNFVQTPDGELYGTIVPDATAGDTAGEGNVWVRPGGTLDVQRVALTDLIPIKDAIDLFKCGDRVRVSEQLKTHGGKVYTVAIIPETGRRVLLSVDGKSKPFHIIMLERLPRRPDKPKARKKDK